MPTTKTSALAKLTPEERDKVITLVAKRALHKHMREMLEENRDETTTKSDLDSKSNPKPS